MTKRIGIIFLLAIFAIALTAVRLGPATRIQTAHAQGEGGCTGCPDGGAKGSCYQCHDFNWFTPNGCQGCYVAGGGLDTALVKKLKERAKVGKFVYVTGKLTGTRMPMDVGWQKVAMPATHDIDEAVARKSMNKCAAKTTSTQ